MAFVQGAPLVGTVLMVAIADGEAVPVPLDLCAHLRGMRTCSAAPCFHMMLTECFCPSSSRSEREGLLYAVSGLFPNLRL